MADNPGESQEDVETEVEEDVDDVDVTDDVESPDNDDGQPALDDDDFADLDAVVDDVTEAEEEESDSRETDDEDDESSKNDNLASTSSSTSSGASRSWGRMYRKGVVSLSEAIVDEFGDGNSEPVSEEEIIAMELDEAFNEWFVQKTGKPEDLSPGQWVGVGTVMLVGGNAATETDLVNSLVSEAADGI